MPECESAVVFRISCLLYSIVISAVAVLASSWIWCQIAKARTLKDILTGISRKFHQIVDLLTNFYNSILATFLQNWLKVNKLDNSLKFGSGVYVFVRIHVIIKASDSSDGEINFQIQGNSEIQKECDGMQMQVFLNTSFNHFSFSTIVDIYNSGWLKALAPQSQIYPKWTWIKTIYALFVINSLLQYFAFKGSVNQFDCLNDRDEEVGSLWKAWTEVSGKFIALITFLLV